MFLILLSLSLSNLLATLIQSLFVLRGLMFVYKELFHCNPIGGWVNVDLLNSLAWGCNVWIKKGFRCQSAIGTAEGRGRSKLLFP